MASVNTPAVAADKPPPNWRRIAPKGENTAPEGNSNSGKQTIPLSPHRGTALSSPNQKAVRQGAETIKAGWVESPVGLTSAAIKTLESSAGFEGNADFSCATPRSENGTTATAAPGPGPVAAHLGHFVKPRPSPTTPGHRRNATWAPGGSNQESSGPLSGDPFAMLALSRAISSPTEHRTVSGEESLISFEDASNRKKDIYRAVTQDGVTALVKTPLGGIAEGYEVVLLDGALEGAAAGPSSAPTGSPYLVPYPSGGFVVQPVSGPLPAAYSGPLYAQPPPVQYVYGYAPGAVAGPTQMYLTPPAAYPTAPYEPAAPVGLHSVAVPEAAATYEAPQASASGSAERSDPALELLQRLSMRTSPYDEGQLSADPNAFADLLPDQIVNVKHSQYVKETMVSATSQENLAVSPEDSATSLTHFVPKDAGDDAAFNGLVQERLSGFTSGRGGASMNASGTPSKLQDPFGGSAIW